MTYQDILKASVGLQTMPIKGKEYVTVNERVKAFRKLIPAGTIETEIISINDSVVVMRAKVYDGALLLATGTAFEVKDSSHINKTSFIENCETSAVGRALAFLGLGIDTSIASSEEVENAIEQQNNNNTIGQVKASALEKLLVANGQDVKAFMKHFNVNDFSELTEGQHYTIVEGLRKHGNNRQAN